MPTISRFCGIAIRMYFADHAPPHFPCCLPGEEVVIALGTGEILGGGMPERALWLVREWAALHPDELAANWDRLQVTE